MSCFVAFDMKLEGGSLLQSLPEVKVSQFCDSRFEGYLRAQWLLGTVCPNAAHPTSKEPDEVLVSGTPSRVKGSTVPLWSFVV